MDNLINYTPHEAAPQTAQLLAPVIPEHQVVDVTKPLVNLVGSLASWGVEAKNKELEKAKLDIAANGGTSTEEQANNWLLSNRDLTDLEISASSQNWGAQHLIDVAKYRHLPPEQYSQHLAQEAKVLTDNSGNPEWMATRLNKESEQLMEAHAREHAQYKVMQGVSSMDNLLGNIVAKGQVTVNMDPAGRDAVHTQLIDSFTEALNDPTRGQFAWMAVKKRTEQQLKDGDPTYFNLLTEAVKRGKLHEGTISNLGLEDAKATYSDAMSLKITQGVTLLKHQQDTGQDTTNQKQYVLGLMTTAATSPLPLTAEAKNQIKAMAQEIEHNPKLVAAKAQQAKQEHIGVLHSRLDSIYKDITEARTYGDTKNTARLLRERDAIFQEAQAKGYSTQELEDFAAHIEGGTNVAIDKGELARHKAEVTPLYDAMKTTNSVDEFLNMAQEVRRSYMSTSVGNANMRNAVHEEARHQVATLTVSKLKEMAAALPEIKASEGDGGVRRHLAEMKKLFSGNTALPLAANKIWVSSVEKTINSYNKEGTPQLAKDLLKQLNEFQSKYAVASGDLDLSPLGKVNAKAPARAQAQMKDFQQAAREAKVPLPLLLSVFTHESGLEHYQPGTKEPKMGAYKDPVTGVVRRSSATGLVQMLEGTAKLNIYSEPYDRNKMRYDPKYNLKRGAELLGYLYNKYNGDMEQAVREYKGGPKGMYNSETDNYTKGVMNHLPRELVALNPGSNASMQADIAEATHKGNTPIYLQEHKRNLQENAPLLEKLTGVKAGATEATYYRALVPEENQAKWNPKAPNAYEEAARLGANPDILGEVYTLAWKSPRLSNSSGDVWSKIGQTKALVDAWEPGKDASKLITNDTDPGTIQTTMYPKEAKVLAPMWEGGNPMGAVQLIIKAKGSSYMTSMVKSFLKGSERGVLPQAYNDAIKELYSPIKGGPMNYTEVAEVGVNRDEAEARKSQALVKAVAGGQRKYLGAEQPGVLSAQYHTDYHKKGSCSDAQYFNELPVTKAMNKDNLNQFWKFFKAAGYYATTPEEQVNFAVQALSQTQYQTPLGIRFSNPGKNGLGDRIKALNRDAPYSSPDNVMNHRLVQLYLRQTPGLFITNHAGENQQIFGSDLIWNYDKDTDSIKGISKEGTTNPVEIPPFIWQQALDNTTYTKSNYESKRFGVGSLSDNFR